MTLHTTLGDIKLNLFGNHAPNTVKIITSLATGELEWTDPVSGETKQEPFYDGVVFHRVIPGFMAQGGDPTGTGTSGSNKPNLKQEFSSEPHVRGVCSMARTSDPNSADGRAHV